MDGTEIEARLLDIERRLAYLEAGRAAMPGQREPSRSASGTVPSARDFLMSKHPTTLNDKVLVAGYYIEVILGETSFNLDRLYQVFDQMRESPPGNRRDPPHNNEKYGFFRPEGTKIHSRTANNRWTLTNAGRARVEAGAFPRPKEPKRRGSGKEKLAEPT